MNIKLYSRIKFVGSTKDYPDLNVGDVGYVIEDYKDGNYEVEFSNPDGSTRVQAVISKTNLVEADS